MQSNSNKEKWNLTNVLQSELFWKLLHKSHTSQKVLTLLNQQWELNTKTWSLWQTDRRVVIWAWDKAGQKKKKKGHDTVLQLARSWGRKGTENVCPAPRTLHQPLNFRVQDHGQITLVLARKGEQFFFPPSKKTDFNKRNRRKLLEEIKYT